MNFSTHPRTDVTVLAAVVYERLGKLVLELLAQSADRQPPAGAVHDVELVAAVVQCADGLAASFDHMLAIESLLAQRDGRRAQVEHEEDR